MALLVGYVAGVVIGNPQFEAINSIFSLLNLEDQSIKSQIMYIGVFTLIVFVLKPLIVLPLSKIVGFGIHRRGADLTNDLLNKFMNLPLSSVRKWSTSEINYVTVQGIPLVLSLLWVGTSLITDVALIVMFFVALIFNNAIITFGLVLYVISLFSLLAWINGNKISGAGTKAAQASSNSTKGILEILLMFRELYVTNRLEVQVSKIKNARVDQGEATATVEWLAQFPRYVIDSAIIVGIVFVAITQSNSQSISDAATTTALFLTAALRILPTIIPIQSSLNVIKETQGLTLKVHTFIKEIDTEYSNRVSYIKKLGSNSSLNDKFTIVVQDLSLKYPDNEESAIEGISFQFDSGTTLAIIGASGAGKTTLADCLLGLLVPTTGKIEIDKTPPEIYRTIKSGAIAYVSQDISLIDGSIRENVAFAISESEIDEVKIFEALEKARIDDFVRNLPQGLETVVGERGTRLSGGQRQRIGIARALYSNPKILVLDEATSALDAETESAITGMLKELHGEVTIISIAHRLSTVMHSDLVLFLRDGKLAGSGKFEDLVKQHPDLAYQAELLGIELDQN